MISGGAHRKHNNKPKNNRQRYGVHEYHMWEVYEVTCGVRAGNKGVLLCVGSR